MALGDIDGVPADIRPARAARHRKVGDAAKERGLHSGSLRLLDRALELLDPSDTGEPASRTAGPGERKRRPAQCRPGVADVEAVAAEAAPQRQDHACAGRRRSAAQLRQTKNELRASVAVIDEALALWRDAGDAPTKPERFGWRA